jgi:hypothetical protein
MLGRAPFLPAPVNVQWCVHSVMLNLLHNPEIFWSVVESIHIDVVYNLVCL